MPTSRVFTFDMPYLPQRAYLDTSFVLRVLREEAIPRHEKRKRHNVSYFERLRAGGSDLWTSPLGLEETVWQLIKPVLSEFGQVRERIERGLAGLERLGVDVRIPPAALTRHREQWLAGVKSLVLDYEIQPADALHLIFAQLGNSDGIVSNDAGFQRAVKGLEEGSLAVYAQNLAP